MRLHCSAHSDLARRFVANRRVGWRIRLYTVLTGKTAVIRRVPVLTGDNRFTARLAPVNQAVSDIHRTVTFRHGERATSTEIIL